MSEIQSSRSSRTFHQHCMRLRGPTPRPSEPSRQLPFFPSLFPLPVSHTHHTSSVYPFDSILNNSYSIASRKTLQRPDFRSIHLRLGGVAYCRAADLVADRARRVPRTAAVYCRLVWGNKSRPRTLTPLTGFIISSPLTSHVIPPQNIAVTFACRLSHPA